MSFEFTLSSDASAELSKMAGRIGADRPIFAIILKVRGTEEIESIDVGIYLRSSFFLGGDNGADVISYGQIDLFIDSSFRERLNGKTLLFTEGRFRIKSSLSN